MLGIFIVRESTGINPWHSTRLPRGSELALWSLPLVVGAIVRYQTQYPALDTSKVATALVALAGIFLTVRRPDRALMVLVVGLPFQLFTQSWLFAKGVPLGILKPAGYWKEILAVGLSVAAFREIHDQSRKLDALDKAVLGFIGVIVIYALFPTLISPNAPTDLTTRYVAARQICGFVVVFFACRHLRLPAAAIKRIVQLAIATACVTAAIVLYEVSFSDQWNTFVVETIQLPHWLAANNNPVANALDIRIDNGTTLRAASVFVTLDFATYLLLPLAFVLQRSLRPGAGPRPALLAGLLSVALLFTQTRNGIVAGVILALLTLWTSRKRQDVAGAAKVRLAFLLVTGLVLIAPLAASSGVADRLQSFVSGTDDSSQQHRDSIDRGLANLVASPLGNGLGTSAGAGQRFSSVVVSADNGYLYVGNEAGLGALVLYVAFAVVIVPWKLKGKPDREPSPEMDALRNTLIAIAIVSIVMQPWVDLSISWTFWAVAGVALAQFESSTRDQIMASATA